MGEANENRFRRSNSSSRAMDVMDCFSLETNRHPGDLLQRFASTFDAQQHKIRPTSEEEEDKEEIELNLGLSLGGRFGVDKTAKKLIRSSSIADVLSATSPVSYPFLTRTSSLPIETEEWRKRKEMQCLRRMQAKRRRCQKQQKNLNANLRGELNFEEERRHLNVNRENWTPAWAKQQRGIGAMNVNRSSNNLRGLAGSQGSVESQGGESSSGMSEMESKPLQRSSSVGEARSTSSDQLVQARSNQDAVGSSRGKTNDNVCRTSGSKLENPSTKFDSSENMGREIGADAMEDLPYVFTKGDGPNGRRIEGILYKYGNGEDVRIICVCHGSFLSPMEFVKHAGGRDVDYPLKHIVVNASGSSFCFHNTLSMSPLE